MSGTFSERLIEAVRNSSAGDDDIRTLVTRAIADTVCVAAPGFLEPVVRNALAAYGGTGAAAWSGDRCESREAAIMINAMAAHALDFDDVFLETLAHTSTVIVPAIVTDQAAEHDPEEILAAFNAGLIAAQAIGQRLGQGHYNKGWHGTGTVGAFAAAAAAGRLHRLSHAQMASAFALCASMSGGVRVNFGTQAKPAHAGFAAVAGTRAVRLVKAGVSGAPDVFGRQGYADLYAGDDGVPMPGDDAFTARPGAMSMKLYPCCYAAHRLIGAALDVRAALGPGIAASSRLQFVATAPAGSLEVLKYDRPHSALEAKFSARFNLAVALLEDVPTLQHYTKEATQRPDIAALMDRIAVVEDVTQPSGGNIEFGKVILEVRDGATTIAKIERAAIPGSPQDPPSRDAVQRKLRACLHRYAEAAGKPFAAVADIDRLGGASWL